MTSQVEVPPLTGLIHFISGKRRVKNLSIELDRPMQTDPDQRHREKGNETNLREQGTWKFGKYF